MIRDKSELFFLCDFDLLFRKAKINFIPSELESWKTSGHGAYDEK